MLADSSAVSREGAHEDRPQDNRGRHGCAFMVTAGVGILLVAGVSHAQDTLVYSFEADLEGFVANGGGITVTQDTIGAVWRD